MFLATSAKVNLSFLLLGLLSLLVEFDPALAWLATCCFFGSGVTLSFSNLLFLHFFDCTNPRLTIWLPDCLLGWFLGTFGIFGLPTMTQHSVNLCPCLPHSVQRRLALFTGFLLGGGGGATLPRCFLYALVLLLRFDFLAALSEYDIPLVPLMLKPGVYLPVLPPLPPAW